MAKTRMNTKDDLHRGVMLLSSNLVAEEAMNLEDEVQTVNGTMQIRMCLEMTLLGFR